MTEISGLADGGKINLADVQALYPRRYLLSWRDSVLIGVALYHDEEPASPRLQGALRRLLKVSRGAGNPQSCGRAQAGLHQRLSLAARRQLAHH